jgi:NitT/TauT family transport system permease protein
MSAGRKLLGAAPVLGMATFLGIWELAVRGFGLKPFELRAPSVVIQRLAEQPGFWWHQSLVTGREATIGFAIALVVALLLGAPLAASRFAERASQPILVLIQVTPFVAYAPSIVLWFGAGWKPKIFLIALVCLPLFTFGAVAGIRATDPASLELFRSVDASPIETWWRLRLPSALPAVFTAARAAVGLSLIVAFLAEQFALSTDGLGVWGKKGASFSDGDLVWGTVFCMALLGTLGLAVIGLLERWLLRWHASQRGAVGYRARA